MDMAQQANGFDCGIYLLAIAEILAASDALPPPGQTAEAILGLTPSAITAKRKALLDTLTQHIAEGRGRGHSS